MSCETNLQIIASSTTTLIDKQNETNRLLVLLIKAITGKDV